MKKFSEIHSQLIYNLQYHKLELERAVKRNPQFAFNQINQITSFVGSKWNVALQLHFPTSSKIMDVNSYGTENIGMVFDKFKKTFPIARERIKLTAKEMLGNVRADDAYMYEGKEGVKIIGNFGRIEILPGSIHLWCKIDETISSFADWLMQEVYSTPSSE